jgi:hypothetical protein
MARNSSSAAENEHDFLVMAHGGNQITSSTPFATEITGVWLSTGSPDIPFYKGVSDMKRQIAGSILFALALGMLQVPALADFNLSFGRNDYNHDGRWNYREFNDANRYYYQHHPDVVVESGRSLRHEFRRLDTDNDGYLNAQEVRTYRNWD